MREQTLKPLNNKYILLIKSKRNLDLINHMKKPTKLGASMYHPTIDWVRPNYSFR